MLQLIVQVNSTASHSQRTSQEARRRSASSNATQDSESNGLRVSGIDNIYLGLVGDLILIDFQRVNHPRKPKTVKSNAKPEKDGSPSQNPSNVSETKFPVINKIPINSIAKYTQFSGFTFEFYFLLVQILLNS